MDLNLPRNERSLLAQLRCGILPLRVETGRYVGETPEQRLCKLCNTGSVEDELHFVMNCSLYQDTRHNYLSEILLSDQYVDMRDCDKFVNIVKHHPRRLAKYLVAAYLKRRSNLFQR